MSESRPNIGGPSFQSALARVAGAITPYRPTPTMHEIWFRACAEAFNPEDRFETVTAGDPDIVAASFFRRRQRALAPRLSLCGIEDAGLLTDVFYEDQAGADALAEAIVKRRAPIRFGPFPGDSLFLAALQSAARGRAFVLAQPQSGLAYIPLDDAWREPEQNFSTGRKAEMRRRRKKAQSYGDVVVDITRPGPQDVDALLDEALAVEASGWKGQNGTAIATNKEALAFFKVYARLASEAGIFRLCFLRIDGKPVAITIGVECDGAFWQYKVGYDEAYKNCSPGTILLLETVKYSAEAGLSAYEFLGNAPWMEEWTTKEHPLTRFNYYPYNPAGAAAFIEDGAKAGIRKIKDRFQRNSAQ